MPTSPNFKRVATKRGRGSRASALPNNASRATALANHAQRDSVLPTTAFDASPLPMTQALASGNSDLASGNSDLASSVSAPTMSAQVIRQDESAHPLDGPAPTGRRINTTISTQSVRCAMSVIPVRIDQTPGEICETPGCTVDRVNGTISITMQRDEQLPTRMVVIAANLNGRFPTFATLRIADQYRMDGQLRIEGTIVNEPADDFLSAQKLSPRIEAQNFSFGYGAPREVLKQWESIGVIRRYLVDRILTCPGCNSIPTWRNACPGCGSARFETRQLIHHFACAHIGETHSFETPEGGLSCPKCRAKHLIVGADFQYTSGPLECLDCAESGCQPVLGCMCHRCMHRFAPSEATEMEVHGYHFERMDLLDLVAASQ
ncbi:hypothetical protein [Planctomycetes bacterium K23_9]|uniref:Thaumarchaeal output domain-containing protein n=1 Tax=Stieleria marina TaxID=1930275 RepID=A0A517NXJ3_9BACT|nr:hypothetical protein K239x_38560 [Planctomycetes bacterium K23_9]